MEKEKTAQHMITNWENDMLDAPEDKVQKFVADFYKGFELRLLSGLRYRSIEDIYETLEDSFAIIIQPSLLDRRQVVELVSGLSHSIWVNFNSNTNNLSVRRFIFLSATPFEDMMQIREFCLDLKDSQGEWALPKIVQCISCQFFGFGGEYYEMQSAGYSSRDIKAVRYK